MPESILIIDDEYAIAAALTARLRHRGHQIHHAMTGLKGVEAVQEIRPDVIILDIRLPDIDGYEVCKRIKALPEHGDTPIIFLSANALESTRVRALEIGGAAFLSKPYESEDIIEAISKVSVDRQVAGQEQLNHV